MEKRIREIILQKARMMGEKAKVDPVPEIYETTSIPARVETMRNYFESLTEDCLSECRREGGSECAALAGEILTSMQKGFEVLLRAQPSYHPEGPENTLSEKADAVQREDASVQKSHEEGPVSLRVEKSHALDFEKEVFNIIRKDFGLQPVG